MSESGVGYLDVILDISILCYSFRFKMQWLAVIVNAIVKFVTNQAKNHTDVQHKLTICKASNWKIVS